MRLGHQILPSQHRSIKIPCFILLTLLYIPLTVAFIPQSSTFQFPTNFLSDTTLKYATTIQLRTNWENLADKDLYITTSQNWTITPQSNINVTTALIPNQQISKFLLQTTTYNYLINTTDNKIYNNSNSYPSVLQGPWEHLWVNSSATNIIINDQEVSLIYNTARVINSTFIRQTNLTYGPTQILVNEYHSLYSFSVGCG